MKRYHVDASDSDSFNVKRIPYAKSNPHTCKKSRHPSDHTNNKVIVVRESEHQGNPRTQRKSQVSRTDLLLKEFEKDIKNKQKIDRKMQEKFMTKTNRTYKKIQKKEMNCPLCNLRLDSNNNLVEM